MNEKHFLCSKCFKNYGLQALAEFLAKDEEIINCENCGRNGLKIGVMLASDLMSSFFVYGSIPPEIGGPAPIYQFNKDQFPGIINFATELDADLELLSNILQVGLFLYGPPAWRMSETKHYYMIINDNVVGEERKKVWEEIIGRCGTEMLDIETLIFRIRNGEKLPPAFPEQFDTPPEEYIKEGRFHTKDFPIFYGALDVETCLHETRATLSDYSMLAVFKPNKKLKILNIANNINDTEAITPFERVDILMEKLVYGGKSEYPLCQEMAMKVKEAGFDGFMSHSYFGQVHKKKLYNINLFGYPVREDKIKLVSTNRVKLTHISYEYRYGPINDTFYPLETDKFDEIMDEWKIAKNSGYLDDTKYADIFNQIKELLNKKSKIPI